MLALIDNYDSFAHNLTRYLRRLGCEVVVVRNDRHSAWEILQFKNLQGIVISPGPCTPNEAGCSLDLVRQSAGKIPILGVCLGHQAIAAAYGTQVVCAAEPRHGRSSRITHDERNIFAGLPNPMTVGRYHSLVVDPTTLPAEFAITAQDEHGVVMAITHRTLPLYGVQFHPESILTESGYALLANFVRLCGFEPTPVEQIQLSELAINVPNEAEFPTRPVTF
ncbi:MAG: aminodeoxychorismate/anthranilate synthase component II [Pirellulales bacterium]